MWNVSDNFKQHPLRRGANAQRWARCARGWFLPSLGSDLQTAEQNRLHTDLDPDAVLDALQGLPQRTRHGRALRQVKVAKAGKAGW